MHEKESPISGDEPIPEEVPERDFSIIWTSFPYPRLLRDRLDREQERLMKEGVTSYYSEAKDIAKAKIEKELTDEEYQSILLEIQSRPARDRIMPPPIMSDDPEADQIPPPEAA